MKKILFLISFLFLLNISFANVYGNLTSLEEISKKMPKMHSIKCKFKQEKSLKNISKPLISSGDFEFIENKGVYFYTKYPVESKTNYTNENFKRINDIVKAISSKKYSKLEKEFNFYHNGNVEKWTLGLKPKEKSDAYKYISSVTLEGSDYIQKIIIDQTNGNKTTIWFTK